MSSAISYKFYCLIALLFSSGSVFAASPDLSSPERTLAGYIESLTVGNKAGVYARYHDIRNFYLPGRVPIEKYTIVKKIVYGEKEVLKTTMVGEESNFKIGDIELQVKQIENGKPYMYSYWFRRFDNGWMIIDHAIWSADPD